MSNDGDHIAALIALQRSSELLQSLSTESPDNATYEFGLAIALNNIGATLQALDRPADALPMFRRGLIRVRRAFAKQPNNVNYARVHLQFLRTIEWAESSLGMEKAANETGSEALELSRKLATANPEVPLFVAARFNAAQSRGRSLAEHGKTKAALPLLREALEVSQSPSIRESQSALTFAPMIAAQIAAILEQTKTADEKAARQDETKSMADLAVKSMELALNAGVSYNVGYLKTSPVMKILRDRNDFKALVARLEKAALSNLASPKAVERPKKDPVTSSRSSIGAVDSAVSLDPELLARGDRAACQYAIGLARLQLGQSEDARKALELALKEREILVRDDPKNIRWKFDIGKIHASLGDIAHEAQQFAKGYNEWKTGFDMIAAVLSESAADDPVASEAASRLNSFGEAMVKYGFWEEASLRFKQARAHGTQVQNWNFHAEVLLYLIRGEAR